MEDEKSTDSHSYRASLRPTGAIRALSGEEVGSRAVPLPPGGARLTGEVRADPKGSTMGISRGMMSSPERPQDITASLSQG